MPPLPLTSLLQTALPELSSASRAVVNTLGCLNGDAPSAQEMAAWVGLRDRHQLARVLRRDGLPPLERLAGWARVLYWLLESETTGASLLEVARREHMDPAVAYRVVRRVTGMRWSQARDAGLAVAVLRLREGCRKPVRATRFPAARLSYRLMEAVGHRMATASAIAHPAASPIKASAQPAWPQAAHHPAAVFVDRCFVGGSPFDVVTTPDDVALVTRSHVASLEVVRLQPFRSVGSVQTGPVPTRVVVSAAGTQAYVTSQFAEVIETVDLATLRPTSMIPVPGHPLGAALTPDGRTLFVTTNCDRLCAVSLPAARVVTTVPVPGVCPALAVHPSGRRVYTPCWRAGLIIESDARTLCPLRRFEVGGTAQDSVVSSDGLTLYAANEGGWLNAIQLTTGRIMTVPLGAPAVSLALSPDEDVLFVGLVFAGRVLVIDRRTLHVRATVNTGGKPRRIAFDRTGRLALVANEAGWVDLLR